MSIWIENDYLLQQRFREGHREPTLLHAAEPQCISVNLEKY